MYKVEEFDYFTVGRNHYLFCSKTLYERHSENLHEGI